MHSDYIDISHLEPVETLGNGGLDNHVVKFNTRIMRDSEGHAHAIFELNPIENASYLEAQGGSSLQTTRVLAEKLQPHLTPPEGFHFKGFSRSSNGAVGMVYEVPEYNLKGISGELDFHKYKKLVGLQFGDWGYATLERDFQLAAEMLEGGKPRTLIDALQHANGALEKDGKAPYEAFINFLKNEPEKAEKINRTLAEGGSNEFTYKGHGRSGAFFLANNGTVVGIRGSNPIRQKTPFHLQAVSSFRNGIAIEVMPALETSGVTKDHVRELVHAVKDYVGPNGERFEFNDPEIRNVGLKDGVPYILDGDAVRQLSAKEASALSKPSNTDFSRWVKPNGEWTQYEAFRDLHTAYKSPLHMEGGKLISEQPVVELPKAEPPQAEKVPSPEPPIAEPQSVQPPKAEPRSAQPPIEEPRGAEPPKVEPIKEPHSAESPKVEPVKEPHSAEPSKSVVTAEAENWVGKVGRFARTHPGKSAAIAAGAVAAIGAGTWALNEMKRKEAENQHKQV
ncbi:MAG: hypothetical protein K2Q12_00320 [Rickettsiales bacterium]|nr:hypothetical protein [Rickettsiales bacterium]